MLRTSGRYTNNNYKLLATLIRNTAKTLRRVTKSGKKSRAAALAAWIPEIADGAGDGLSKPDS